MADLYEFLYVNFRIIKAWEVFCGLAIIAFLAAVAKCMYKNNMISKQQSNSLILLGIYLEVLFALTLLLRIPTDQRRKKIKVFWSWEHIYQNKSLGLLIDNILNLFMFFPVGCLVFVLTKGKIKVRYVFLFGLVLSGMIELAQLFLCRGYFEWDDIIHNVFGCCTGYCVMLYIEKCICKRHHLTENGNCKSYKSK